MRTYRKTETERIELGIGWSDLGEGISASSWTIDAGLDTADATHDYDETEITVYGGTEGEQYRCTNQITTESGLIMERSFMVQVVDR